MQKPNRSDNQPPRKKKIHRNNPKFDRKQNEKAHFQKNEKTGRIGRLKGKKLGRRDRDGEKPPRKDKPVKKSEDAPEKGRTLKVLGLHPDFTNEDLNVNISLIQKLFGAQGALEKCLIELDNFGRSLTTAIVRYHTAESAKNAIQALNQHKIMNSILTVEPYKNKPRK